MTPEVTAIEKRPPGYPRPFPRDCINCAQTAVYPETITLETEELYEGIKYPLVLENFTIPICRACGEKTFTEVVDREINRRFREYLRLLSPEQIQSGIEHLATTPLQLSQRLGIAVEKLDRYLRGWEMQPRAIDNLMRLYFASAEVRGLLRGKEQDPNLGVVAIHSESPEPVLGEAAFEQAKI